jgi:hypothetical protein
LLAQLENQKIVNYELMHKFEEMNVFTQSLNDKIVNQNTTLHHDLKGYMSQIDQKQRVYLDKQF